MTTSAVVYTFLFVHIRLVLVVTAYCTLGATLAPVLIQRSRVRCAHRPWLPIVLGMVISVPWVVVALVLLDLPAAPLKFAGAALAGLWVLCGLIGDAGSRNTLDPAVRSTRRPGCTASDCVSLTWILPLDGWLVMLPLTLAARVGCLAMGLLPVQPRRVQPLPEHPVTGDLAATAE